MKRIFIPMSVVCFLVASLVSLPRAEEDKSTVPEAPAAKSKQSVDQAESASLSVMTGCCEIPGDANDDGVLNPYDFLFAFSNGIQSYGNPFNVYPDAFCFDQMLDGTASHPSHLLVLAHAVHDILPHLFFDEDITLVCGTRGE